jgi:hypothetical protein
VLNPEAKANLVLMKGIFGNRLFPDFEGVPRETLDVFGEELRPKLTAIAADHFAIIDRIPGPWFAGNEPCEYDFSEPMPLPVASVAHLKR